MAFFREKDRFLATILTISSFPKIAVTLDRHIVLFFTSLYGLELKFELSSSRIGEVVRKLRFRASFLKKQKLLHLTKILLDTFGEKMQGKPTRGTAQEISQQRTSSPGRDTDDTKLYTYINKRNTNKIENIRNKQKITT